MSRKEYVIVKIGPMGGALSAVAAAVLREDDVRPGLRNRAGDVCKMKPPAQPVVSLQRIRGVVRMGSGRPIQGGVSRSLKGAVAGNRFIHGH